MKTTGLFRGEVRLSDAVEGLREMARDSAALVLSDLPSGATKARTDRPPDLDALWPEVWRVLRPRGTAVFMASHMRFAATLIASQPRWFRYDLVWHKARATGFFNSSRQPLRAHEHILVFFRAQGTFNPQMSRGHRPISTARRKPDTGHGTNYGPAKRGGHESRAGATDRFPISVIRTPVVPNIGPERRHHQQKHEAVLRWLIASYTDPDELVVDPYAGSGSTGDAAIQLGRRFEGFDSDPRFGVPATSRSNARET